MNKTIQYIYIPIFLLLAMSSFIEAQQKTINSINPKSQKHYKKAISYFKKQEYSKATKYLEKVIEKEPNFIKPYLYQASINFEKKDYPASEKYYKQVIKIDSLYKSSIYYSLGFVLEMQNKLDEALLNYKKYLFKTPTEGKFYQKTIRKVTYLPYRILAYNNPVQFDPIPFGSAINTEHSEYLPTLTGDNQKMIFTRRVNQKEDFYISNFENGKWETAVPFKELNTPLNEGAQTISSDGKELFFAKDERMKTYGSFDLFYSKKRNSEWSEPKNIGNTINSVAWDSQPSISSDGQTIYFASNRPGGVGGLDIWVSKKSENGKWSVPICMDTTINTVYDEQAPFIHPDNQTLYFISNGHIGMGGDDLFFSQQRNGFWRKAKNLGYPINTSYNEGPLFVSLDGQIAYFSSDRQNSDRKNLDIYYFKMPDEIKPYLVNYVKGIVVDKHSKTPIEAVLNLYNNETGGVIRTITTDKDTFFVALPVGIDYNLTIEKEGYVFYSERFVFKQDSSISYLLKIELNKIPETTKNEESKPIVLNNIIFKYKSFELDPILSKVELNNLLKLLLDNPKIEIQISGHTDNIGNDEFNLELSEKRANSIFNYLVGNKINKNRLSFKGFGKSRPIATNDTEEGRSRNRRTEFVIIITN